MLKEPSTGRRVSRPNASSKWQTIDAPHLRIVDQAIFDQVSKRLASVGGPLARQAPRSKRMLSGLLRCGCCGGGMSIIASDRSGPRIQCSVSKESGACSNSTRYYVQKIERIVIEALRLQLSEPELIRGYVKAYREERRRAESEARRKRSTLDTDYAKAKAAIQRIVVSIAKGAITEDEAASVLDDTRRELARLEIELATADTTTNVVELHPQAVQRFKENVEALAEILTQNDAQPNLELIATFRALVERVIVHPRKAGEEHEVSIKGQLASLMGTEVSAVVMVAREGLEPPTPGL
jgi:site-specific DNA recombinase